MFYETAVTAAEKLDGKSQGQVREETNSLSDREQTWGCQGGEGGGEGRNGSLGLAGATYCI